MQTDYNSSLEASRKFFDDLYEEDLNNYHLTSLSCNIKSHKAVLQNGDGHRDQGLFQYADLLLKHIANLHKINYDKFSKYFKTTKDDDFGFLLRDDQLEDLRYDPSTTLTENLGSVNSEVALKILRYAADELNFSKTQALLGKRYLDEENYPEAIRYWKMAAPRNDVVMANLESLAKAGIDLAQQALDELGV